MLRSPAVRDGPWRPLALVPTNDGMEARIERTLVLTEQCAFIESGGERALLAWPADGTSWLRATAEVSFRRSGGQVVTMADGQRVVLGGGWSSMVEDGLSAEDWADRIDWVAPPDPGCIGDVRWLVSDVIQE